MSMTIAAVHAGQTMKADDKGSLVNRTKCAGEHFKNDMIAGVKTTALTGAGVGIGAIISKKPNLATNAVAGFGKVTTGFGKLLGKLKLGGKAGKLLQKVNQAGSWLQKVGTKIIEKAPKHGKAAVLCAVGATTLLGLAKIAADTSYKAGKIDQKYIDNAKIEKMTGSVVV